MHSSFVRISLVALVALVALGPLACSSSDDDTTPTTTDNPGVTYVGKTGTTAIALTTATSADASGKVQAAVYICDGTTASRWYYGSVTGGTTIDATSDAGGAFHGTLAAGVVTGKIDLPSGNVDVTLPQASGVAGIYLVQQTPTHADGYSSLRAHLVGDIANAQVTGTITPDGGGAAVTLQGTVASFGDASGDASWIVQPDGSVNGSAGGGNCSAWASIKGLMFGVYCGFYKTAK